MKIKYFLLAVLVAVVAAAAFFGYKRHSEYVRKCADDKGKTQLRAFYKLAGDGYPDEKAKAELAKLIGEMELTSKKCGPDMYESLFARRLDGAFIVGDYAKAEALMDDFTGKSKNWKVGAKAKIRAHAALDSGDKATAIKEFLGFIDAMKAEPGDFNEIDPYSGVEWTKEMIIGRNLKRIGDLHADLGHAEESAKFIAEAKEVFKVALEKAKDDPDMKAAVLKDAGDLLK